MTVSTTYEQPYSLARRLSTLDHLTKGRLGWNIVTGYLDSAARNLGLNALRKLNRLHTKDANPQSYADTRQLSMTRGTMWPKST